MWFEPDNGAPAANAAATGVRKCSNQLVQIGLATPPDFLLASCLAHTDRKAQSSKSPSREGRHHIPSPATQGWEDQAIWKTTHRFNTLAGTWMELHVHGVKAQICCTTDTNTNLCRGTNLLTHRRTSLFVAMGQPRTRCRGFDQSNATATPFTFMRQYSLGGKISLGRTSGEELKRTGRERGMRTRRRIHKLSLLFMFGNVVMSSL